MKFDQRYSAFTITHRSIRKKLMSEVVIKANGKDIKGQGQWDTGAFGSCISKKVVEELELVPTGKLCIMTPSGSDIVDTYSVEVILPNNVDVPAIIVSGSSIGDQGIDMLIGMDIISMGDFAVTNFEGKTVFSFVMPSFGKIDFLPKVLSIGNAMRGHMRKRKKR